MSCAHRPQLFGLRRVDDAGRDGGFQIVRGQAAGHDLLYCVVGVERFDDDVGVRIDANFGGNGHRLPRDRLGVERLIEKSAGSGEGIIAARADSR